MPARVPVFQMQFPSEQVAELAGRFPAVDDSAGHAAGTAARARGHYRRAEFIVVCAWKTARSAPKVAVNTEAAVIRALDSLGVTGRSPYPISFWLAYLEACRGLAARCARVAADARQGPGSSLTISRG